MNCGTIHQRDWGWIINPTGQILSRTGDRFCTGFLIGQQTFLTAGHCLGEVCRRYEEEGNFRISFNYHVDTREQTYSVSEVLEQGVCRDLYDLCDYGIFRLARSDAYRNFGALAIQPSHVDERESRLVIAQHPNGGTKKIAHGSLVGYEAHGLFAHNMDTLGGSSGSPVAKVNRQAVVGVHVSAGDTAAKNFALDIETIAQNSEIISQILGR